MSGASYAIGGDSRSRLPDETSYGDDTACRAPARQAELTLFLLLLLTGSVASGADAPKVRVDTFTYKRVGDLEIKADVLRADDNICRPVAVWIHGGALINGHRAGIDGRMRSRLLDAGYAIVSIDYRLAPETQLPAIIADIEDALAWVREKGPELFNVDTSRIAVVGGSAGGYLTLVSGYRAKTRPKVLVALWGYGDLVGDWYSTPSPHPMHQRIKVSSEEAHKQVSGPPVSDSRDRKGDGGAFYQFCRQHGTWPMEVSGWNPKTEADKFNPYMPVKNVTAEYPPTLLIHGDKDTDVPYEQSVMMVDQFRRHNVKHQLVSIPNAEHGLADGDPKLIEAAYNSALEFINREMKK